MDWVKRSVGNAVIQAGGSPKFAMAPTFAVAVVNIILDPVFIFAFQWGMMRAAVATVIGQRLTAVLAVGYILRILKRKFWNIQNGGSVVESF